MRRMFGYAVALAVLTTPLHAQLNFSTVSTAPTQGSYGSGVWYNDRYAPGVFQNTTWQSRSDVVQVGIREADNAAGRGSSFSGPFYATQGRRYDLTAANAGRFFLSADLWVEESWASAANGFRRTDLWGIGSNGTQNTNVNTGSITSYPVIGFTNPAFPPSQVQ